MAKTSLVNLNSADIDKYYSCLRTGSRFSFARVVKKNTFMSYDKLQALKDKSYLKDIAAIWATLTTEEKEAWKAVHPGVRKNGWQMFVKDTCIRFKANLEGWATPSPYHQDWIGIISMLEGAQHFKINQSHPTTYDVRRKVVGKKGMYEIVHVQEDFYLPLELEISYKSDLSADGENPSAKFYADILSHYQGRDIHTRLEINFDLQSDWQRVSAIKTAVLGVARSYELYIELIDVKGNLYFDNISANHNGQNWARDPKCDNIVQANTSVFFTVEKHWEVQIDSVFAFFGSGYLDTNI